MRRAASVCLLTLLGVLATGLTGCAAPEAPAALPDGVTVDVYQTRTDLPARKLEISVTNAGPDAITILSAEFASPQFAETAVWSARTGGSVVHAGFAVDLPVQLPGPDCEDAEPTGIVRLGFATADGQTGTAELPAIDRYDRLPVMRAEDCYAASVAEVAVLSIDDPVRIGDIAGAMTAFVHVAVAPTGATGSFTIDAVEDTVLLSLRDSSGDAVDELQLGLRVAGTDAPSVLEIPILPGRCDPHAIAEDKQGTIFILNVTAPDGTQGRIRLAAASPARASIYAFFAEYCGLP
jgi:hypothetical protein